MRRRGLAGVSVEVGVAFDVGCVDVGFITAPLEVEGALGIMKHRDPAATF